jgi:hypothetical protein
MSSAPWAQKSAPTATSPHLSTRWPRNLCTHLMHDRTRAGLTSHSTRPLCCPLTCSGPTDASLRLDTGRPFKPCSTNASRSSSAAPSSWASRASTKGRTAVSSPGPAARAGQSTTPGGSATAGRATAPEAFEGPTMSVRAAVAAASAACAAATAFAAAAAAGGRGRSSPSSASSSSCSACGGRTQKRSRHRAPLLPSDTVPLLYELTWKRESEDEKPRRGGGCCGGGRPLPARPRSVSLTAPR